MVAGREGESRGTTALDQAYLSASEEVRRVSDETRARLRTLGKVMRAEGGRVEKRLARLTAVAVHGNSARRAFEASGAKHVALADRIRKIRARLRTRAGAYAGGAPRHDAAKDTVAQTLGRIHAALEAAGGAEHDDDGHDTK